MLTLLDLVPPAPVQEIVKVFIPEVVRFPVDSLPLGIDFVVLRHCAVPFVAVQGEVVLLTVHLIVVDALYAMLYESAVIFIIGAGGAATVMLILLDLVPPAPVQERLYVYVPGPVRFPVE